MNRLFIRRLIPILLVLCGPAAAGDDRLVQLVQETAMLQAGESIEAPDRFEALSCRVLVPPMELGADVTLEPVEIGEPNSSGMIRARYRVLDGGELRGEAQATVRGTVRGPALVATRPLPRGERIPVSAVAVVDANLTRLQHAPIRSLDELGGRVPLRTLGKGRVLDGGLVGAAAVVHRGQPVDLRIVRGSLVVVAAGTAMHDGAPGETVRARNSSTGVELLGRVQPDGSLLVVRGSRRGNR